VAVATAVGATVAVGVTVWVGLGSTVAGITVDAAVTPGETAVVVTLAAGITVGVSTAPQPTRKPTKKTSQTYGFEAHCLTTTIFYRLHFAL
jgi:hypothetical protein